MTNEEKIKISPVTEIAKMLVLAEWEGKVENLTWDDYFEPSRAVFVKWFEKEDHEARLKNSSGEEMAKNIVLAEFGLTNIETLDGYWKVAKDSWLKWLKEEAK